MRHLIVLHHDWLDDCFLFVNIPLIAPLPGKDFLEKCLVGIWDFGRNCFFECCNSTSKVASFVSSLQKGQIPSSHVQSESKPKARSLGTMKTGWTQDYQKMCRKLEMQQILYSSWLYSVWNENGAVITVLRIFGKYQPMVDTYSSAGLFSTSQVFKQYAFRCTECKSMQIL